MGGVIHTVTNVLHVLDPQLLALVLLSATWAWSDREDRSRQHEASMALIQSCMNASAPAVPFERLRTRLDN